MIDLTGEQHRLGHVVGFRPPAEGAAEILVVDLHLLDGQARSLGRGGLRARRRLGADPHLAPSLVKMDRAVQRLHRGMGDHRQPIGGLDGARRAGEAGRHVAGGRAGHGFSRRSRFQIGEQRCCREGGVRAVVPGDRERVEPLLRGRPVIGHDGDGIVDAQHLAHAGNRTRRSVVHRGEPAAEHRRGHDRRHLHAGKPHVDAELRGAPHLLAGIQPPVRRADQAEALRLQRHVVRDRQRRGALDEVAIADPPPAGVVQHGAVAGPAGSRIDVPERRRSGDQHLARGGAGPPHRLPGRAHGERTVGLLVAHDRVGIERVVGGRMLHRHGVEADLQLLGDQHGHRGVGALPHLDIGHGQRHRAVGGDAQKGVGRETRYGAGRRLRAQRHADHQGAGGRRSGRQKGPAGESHLLAHGWFSLPDGSCAAARLIASLMRL